MVVLGIVLIVLAVLFGLGVSVSSSASTTMEVFGVHFGVVVPTVFFLGAAAGVALVLGLWFAKKGLGRGYRRHKEVKELRQQVEAAPPTTTTTTAPAATSSTTADEPATGVGSGVDSGGHHVVDNRTGSGIDNAAGSDERLATEPRTVAEGTETPRQH